MKHLKKYNESVANEENIRQDIREICYDITDYNGYMIGNFNKYIVDPKIYIDPSYKDIKKFTRVSIMKPGFVIYKFDDVKEVCLRIKDYLGDKYINFCYWSNGGSGISFATLNDNIELDTITQASINFTTE